MHTQLLIRIHTCIHRFHGTSQSLVDIIAQYGFDCRTASKNGLYGAGTYFASDSCKSHQYAHKRKENGDHVMLLCRVTMGWPYLTKTSHSNTTRPPDNAATPGRPFDSIFAQSGVARAGQQVHHEFVMFEQHQVCVCVSAHGVEFCCRIKRCVMHICLMKTLYFDATLTLTLLLDPCSSNHIEAPATEFR